MYIRILMLCAGILLFAQGFGQPADPFSPDMSEPRRIPGYVLRWNDEFNANGRPDPVNWTYEGGFVRNEELQWYQPDNVRCTQGVLLFEARREKKNNPRYQPGSKDWRTSRAHAFYTSASIHTRGLQWFRYGRFEIRARVDTSAGSWPAIWTLGRQRPWPLNGEVDLMEFYRYNGAPTLLANMAWGRDSSGRPVWNTGRSPLSDWLEKDPEWPRKFHVWRMDWTPESIELYLDDVLMNRQSLAITRNPDGSNPFQQPHYLLLNLAIGGNGGDPALSNFPIRYEVDYVRFYSREE